MREEATKWTVTGASSLPGVSVRRLAEEVSRSGAGPVTTPNQVRVVTTAKEALQKARVVTTYHVLLSQNQSMEGGRIGLLLPNALLLVVLGSQ